MIDLIDGDVCYIIVIISVCYVFIWFWQLVIWYIVVGLDFVKSYFFDLFCQYLIVFDWIGMLFIWLVIRKLYDNGLLFGIFIYFFNELIVDCYIDYVLSVMVCYFCFEQEIFF